MDKEVVCPSVDERKHRIPEKCLEKHTTKFSAATCLYWKRLMFDDHLLKGTIDLNTDRKEHYWGRRLINVLIRIHSLTLGYSVLLQQGALWS